MVHAFLYIRTDTGRNDQTFDREITPFDNRLMTCCFEVFRRCYKPPNTR